MMATIGIGLMAMPVARGSKSVNGKSISAPKRDQAAAAP
jgi:hypothetical protein